MNRGKEYISTIAAAMWNPYGQEAVELRYAATVSIWVRWGFQLAILLEASYRVEYGAPSHILNTLYVLSLMGANGYVWWKIRSTGRVEPLWLLALSALDVACLAFSMSLSGGFVSRYFPMYYFGVALFAWLFASPYLVLLWTTLGVAVYVSVCVLVGDGVDLGRQDEKVLFYRCLGLYAVALSVNMVTRFERLRRLEAVRREGELSRQRIEMSQTIHDTTAQSAYMLGLGLEEAIEMSGRSDPGLRGRLEALRDLSRSTMWELRHPIDGGRLMEGGTLGEVLTAHTDTFTSITSIPAKLVQVGDEPLLSRQTRTLLFSIAHNALTNAFRHSGASAVIILLQFDEEGLGLSVTDDGVGLPEDHVTRGHGFRNMQADAARLGGEFFVRTSEDGATVGCRVDFRTAEGGF